MTSNRRGGIDRLLAPLVAHRLVVYLGGLVAIWTPRLLESAFDVTLGPSVRTAIVVTSLATMIATYVGERRARGASERVDQPPSGEGAGYPLRMRVAVAMAVLGLAAGVFVALEVDLLAGLLFVGGAYFFAYLAYRGDETEDEEGSDA